MSEYLDVTIKNGTIYQDGALLDLNQNGVKLVITKPRNLKYHRLIMKMLDYTFICMKPIKGINSNGRLLLAFKDYSGMYDLIPSKNGNIKDYRSISFGSMDEIEFNEISEEIKQFCYIVLNNSKCSEIVINGLMEIEF